MQPVDWRTRRPGFQRRSYCNGSHSNRSLASPAFGGCSFLRDSRAERHSAVQRSPRSHSSASLRSRSAMAFSSVARASLRYRIARALLMHLKSQRNRTRIQVREKDLVPGRPLARCAIEGIARPQFLDSPAAFLDSAERPCLHEPGLTIDKPFRRTLCPSTVRQLRERGATPGGYSN